mmetsp:Transcript_23186/g.53799  ORF Transcript_23186/g.53799 Transcript_23186/m.53799 type:complete len:209 (+) Transcript_23186:1804-2430(+)
MWSRHGCSTEAAVPVCGVRTADIDTGGGNVHKGIHLREGSAPLVSIYGGDRDDFLVARGVGQSYPRASTAVPGGRNGKDTTRTVETRKRVLFEIASFTPTQTHADNLRPRIDTALCGIHQSRGVRESTLVVEDPNHIDFRFRRYTHHTFKVVGGGNGTRHVRSVSIAILIPRKIVSEIRIAVNVVANKVFVASLESTVNDTNFDSFAS